MAPKANPQDPKHFPKQTKSNTNPEKVRDWVGRMDENLGAHHNALGDVRGKGVTR